MNPWLLGVGAFGVGVVGTAAIIWGVDRLAEWVARYWP